MDDAVNWSPRLESQSISSTLRTVAENCPAWSYPPAEEKSPDSWMATSQSGGNPLSNNSISTTWRQFWQGDSLTPPHTYQIIICMHIKIWERLLSGAFRSLFFAFSRPEFPQLENGNITKCIHRKKNQTEGTQFTWLWGWLWGTSPSSTLVRFLTL